MILVIISKVNQVKIVSNNGGFGIRMRRQVIQTATRKQSVGWLGCEGWKDSSSLIRYQHNGQASQSQNPSTIVIQSFNWLSYSFYQTSYQATRTLATLIDAKLNSIKLTDQASPNAVKTYDRQIHTIPLTERSILDVDSILYKSYTPHRVFRFAFYNLAI